MESFSEQIKKEVANLRVKNLENALAYLSALVKTAGTIQKNGNRENIVIFTELIEIYEKVNELIKILFNESAELVISDENSFARNNRYEIVLPASISQRVIEETEIFEYDENRFPILNSGISKYVVYDEETAKAYIRGAILGCFTCNINFFEEKKQYNSGYHIEFLFTNEKLSYDFGELLAQFDIISKKIMRNNFFVLYVKDLDSISNLLALVGATKAVIKLQNESTIRQVRNDINRQNNCFSGNISKTVNASLRQIEDIKIIMSTIGLESLDVPLQSVAKLRLENPDENLECLVKLSAEKISKSGLFHRFKKIEKIANNLKEWHFYFFCL